MLRGPQVTITFVTASVAPTLTQLSQHAFKSHVFESKLALVKMSQGFIT